MSDRHQALLDTSVLIAVDKRGAKLTLPDGAAISVVTLAELRMGVILARQPEEHLDRLRTLSTVEALFEPLPITPAVAYLFAEIVGEARTRGRRPKAMDTWIAATAVANDLTLYTQDAGFDGLIGVRVVRV